MTEVGSSVASDVEFHLHPASISLLYSFALHADRQYSTKVRQFSLPSLIQCPLRLNSIRHIDAASDVAQELAIPAKERRSSVEDPPIYSIMALQPVFHLKWSSFSKCVKVGVKA